MYMLRRIGVNCWKCRCISEKSIMKYKIYKLWSQNKRKRPQSKTELFTSIVQQIHNVQLVENVTIGLGHHHIRFIPCLIGTLFHLLHCSICDSTAFFGSHPFWMLSLLHRLGWVLLYLWLKCSIMPTGCNPTVCFSVKFWFVWVTRISALHQLSRKVLYCDNSRYAFW